MEKKTTFSKRTKRHPDLANACTKCQQVKEPSKFHLTSSGTLRSWCRECVNKKALEYYHTWSSKKARANHAMDTE
jgi:hypothetical protein